jgi:hypothetical protein
VAYSLLLTWTSRGKQIPTSTNGFDTLDATVSVELLPQVADMHVNRPIEWSKFPSKSDLGQIFPRQRLTCIANQDLKQGEFHRRQIEQLAIDPGFTDGGIDRDISSREAV